MPIRPFIHSNVNGASTKCQALGMLQRSMTAMKDKSPCPPGGHILLGRKQGEYIYDTLGDEKCLERKEAGGMQDTLGGNGEVQFR